MSRLPRAGTAAGKITIRATAAERELWEAAADASGAASLSDAVRPAITAWAIVVVDLKMPTGKRKAKLLTVETQAERGAPSKRRRSER